MNGRKQNINRRNKQVNNKAINNINISTSISLYLSISIYLSISPVRSPRLNDCPAPGSETFFPTNIHPFSGGLSPGVKQPYIIVCTDWKSASSWPMHQISTWPEPQEDIYIDRQRVGERERIGQDRIGQGMVGQDRQGEGLGQKSQKTRQMWSTTK